MMPASTGVDHKDGLRGDRLRKDRVGDTKAVEHRKDIGTELNAVADNTEFRCLFEYAHSEALSPEGERCRNSAKATTNNKN